MGTEYFLVSSALLNGLSVSKGDILRENATGQTVKVLNVYGNQSPNRAGIPFQKTLDAFSFLS